MSASLLTGLSISNSMLQAMQDNKYFNEEDTILLKKDMTNNIYKYNKILYKILIQPITLL